MTQIRNSGAVLVAALLVVIAALVLTERPVASSDANGIGRYMIVVGNYSVVAGPGLPDNDDVVLLRGGVFKIDTATGQTWMLSERVNTGSIIAPSYDRKWVTID
jgi:hypothetical protein